MNVNIVHISAIVYAKMCIR